MILSKMKEKNNSLIVKKIENFLSKKIGDYMIRAFLEMKSIILKIV